MNTNILKKFNDAMDYIEDNLCGYIDENEIFKITTYSYSVFSRVFSVLSGIPLGEYIRNRRLSKAAIEIKSKNSPIIDIYFKYGYSSPESFSYAFKRFHGFSPIDVVRKKDIDIKIFPPMRFTISVSASSNYKIRLKKMDEMNFVGVTKVISPEEMTKDIWESMLQELERYESIFLSKEKLFGMFYIDKNDNKFRYTLGYLSRKEIDIACELTKISVPANEYAMIEIMGGNSSGIHEAWKYLVGIFLPEESLEYSGDVDFEVFYMRDDKKYDMELWVPVKPSLEL